MYLYRITSMWFGRLEYVSLLFLLRSASVREEVIHEHKKGQILIQDMDLVDLGGTGIRRYDLDKFNARDVSLLCCGVDMNSKT